MATKANTTNPCNCPEGYTLIAETGECQKIDTIPAIPKEVNYNLCKISPASAFYNNSGTRFYDDITLRPKPVANTLLTSTLFDAASVVVNVNSSANNALWQSRLNSAGIRGCPPTVVPPSGCTSPPCGQWVGVTTCLPLTQTKTYCIAISGDNNCRFSINGVLTAQISGNASFAFNYLHVFPITLNAGFNVISVEMLNNGSIGGFVAEIYDDTVANLAAMTVLSQLTPKIVWSTISQLGTQWQTGTSVGFSCPPGYFYSQCDGCVKITTIDQPTCNLVLTSCCGSTTAVIPSGAGLDYTNLGQTVCIEDIDPSIGCWQVSKVTQDPPTVTSFTLGSLYANCDDCQTLGCKECPQSTYIVLKDCCTNLPFTIINGGIEYVFVLQYDGSYIGNNSPSNLQGLGITEFRASDDSVSYYGCWYIEEITALPEDSLLYNWENTMADVLTVPSCKDCSCCTPQYELTNCADETETLIVTGDLAQYVGGVIKIQGCEDICWKVANDFDCRPCQQHVTVVQDFPPTGGYGKICTYTLPQAPSGAITVDIVIDGTTYSLAYSANVYILVGNLNTLGVALFTIDDLGNISATGQNIFGPLSIVGTKDTVSTNPICSSGQLYNCAYGPVSQTNTGVGQVKVVIDGTTYISGIIDVATNAANATAWLNSLNLGVFTINTITTIPLVYSIIVTGNHTYGLLTLPRPEGNQNYEPNCVELVDPDTGCAACLPPPAPLLPPSLIQRFVKPGYTTIGCDPEYTEKVSCNYSDQLYQLMLKNRYGITVCCDPNFEYWLIKKALLEFKQNTPLTEDLVPPVVCYCYEIAVSAGDINFKYISCDGNCTVVLVTAGNTINVCSQSYPHPVCSDSTTITGYTITASNTQCESNQDCNIFCQCINVTGNSKFPNKFEYKDCATGSTKTVTLVFKETVNICAVENTFRVIDNDPVDVIGGPCTTENDCITCVSVTATASLDFRTSVLSYTDCLGNFQEVSLPSGQLIEFCCVPDSVAIVSGDFVFAIGDPCLN